MVQANLEITGNSIAKQSLLGGNDRTRNYQKMVGRRTGAGASQWPFLMGWEMDKLYRKRNKATAKQI